MFGLGRKKDSRSHFEKRFPRLHRRVASRVGGRKEADTVFMRRRFGDSHAERQIGLAFSMRPRRRSGQDTMILHGLPGGHAGFGQ